MNCSKHIPQTRSTAGRAWLQGKRRFKICYSSAKLRGPAPAYLTPVASEVATQTWTGDDEFSRLNDRKDELPLDLPEINAPKRIVLVRHGQSTWNAEGRIQGSSNFSVLTPKGVAQAETTRSMLSGDSFDILFHSPLERAHHTARIIWGQREASVRVLPTLREVDLYSFQGLVKDEGKARFGENYQQWSKRPAEFEIDDHAPVRELWYRASLAWQQILGTAEEVETSLVVAHNAVNQALIASALGLSPEYFRRLRQSNAATSVLDFQPTLSGKPRVVLDRLNQSPDRPYKPAVPGQRSAPMIVLVRHAACDDSLQGMLLGQRDDPMGPLGRMQAHKTAEFLMDMQIGSVLSSPLQRAVDTASIISEAQAIVGFPSPSMLVLDQLCNLELGSLTGESARMLGTASVPADAESLVNFHQRVAIAWRRILQQVNACEGGQTVAVVSHSLVHGALLAHCLGLDANALFQFRSDHAGVTILDFPDGLEGPPAVRCMNYTAHLGRWAVPVTRDDLDSLCGVDGCF